MGVFIPGDVRSEIQRLKLRSSWIKRKDFPFADYFETIDEFRQSFCRHFPELPDPNWDWIVPYLVKFLDKEEALAAYIDDSKVDMTIGKSWADACLAAAFLIAEKYEKALAEKEWPPDDED